MARFLHFSMALYTIHYISGFDVLNSIKVYDFLELYNLSYDLYDEAVKEFQQLLDQQNLAY